MSTVNSRPLGGCFILVPAALASHELAGDDGAFEERFNEAMDDDFNTAEALAVLFDLARRLNRARGSDPQAAEALAGLLRRLGGILGILDEDADDYLKGTEVLAEVVTVNERIQGRKRIKTPEALHYSKIERLIKYTAGSPPCARAGVKKQ